MGKMKVKEASKSDYESLRNARMSENKLESLGILDKVSKLLEETTYQCEKGLRSYSIASISENQGCFRRYRCYRRDDRGPSAAPRRSYLVKSSISYAVTPKQENETTEKGEEEKKNCIVTTDKWEEEKRPANAPLVELNPKDVKLFLSAENSGRRCDSKGRGSIYNPLLGICCHFCRQKKLCGEEDCQRCGNCDVNKPCQEKTDCSVCHSSNGVFCRAYLKVRYGEEMEEVRENKEWMCPHCIEEKGIRPYWICNS